MRTMLASLLLASALSVATFVARADDDTSSPKVTNSEVTIRTMLVEATEYKGTATDELQAADSELKKLKSSGSTSPEKIKELESKVKVAQNKLKLASDRVDALTNAAATHTSWSTNASILAAVGTLVLLVILGVLVWFGNRSNTAEDDTLARVRLAKVVTIGALTFIVFVSGVTLLLAGIGAAVDPQEAARDRFFEVAKWILATVLPVVAAWVGSVLTFYFGKENFKAATDNAKDILKLTPQQKLASKKAGECGKAIGDATVFTLTAGAVLEDTKLTDLEAGYRTFARLPILDDKGCVKGCLHKSTLTEYTTALNETDRNDRSKMTLGALMKTLDWSPDKSFDTVQPTDDLTRAQAFFKARKECSDVFVTSDGTTANPALRWITNDDIVQIENATT